MFFGTTIALSLKSTNFFIMNELKHQHQIAKDQATFYMKNGQINDYFNALLEIQRYKRLMVAVVAN